LVLARWDAVAAEGVTWPVTRDGEKRAREHSERRSS